MSYSFVRKDKSIHLRLSDSVDLSQTQLLKNEFEELMSQDLGAVVVDAEGLTYIDSSGIAALLYLRKSCARYNARFIVEFISEAGYRVAQLAKLEGLLGLPKPYKVQSPSGGDWAGAGAVAGAGAGAGAGASASLDQLELSTDDVKNLFDDTSAFAPPAPPTYSGPVAKPASSKPSSGSDDFDIKPGSFS
jgi:anti-anti-sigma factor